MKINEELSIKQKIWMVNFQQIIISPTFFFAKQKSSPFLKLLLHYFSAIFIISNINGIILSAMEKNEKKKTIGKLYFAVL